MEPKVNEYWHISTVKVLGNTFDLSPPSYKEHELIAKCVSITKDGPIFYGPSLVNHKYVYYGNGFYNCQWIEKWKPNWLWKMLGYK